MKTRNISASAILSSLGGFIKSKRIRLLLLLGFQGGLASAQSPRPVPSIYASDMTVNYVREFRAKKPITDPLLVDGVNVAEVEQATSYVDGLGRPLQTVSKQASPSKKDIVQAIEYDPFGRQQYSYLPFSSTVASSGGGVTDNGQFKDNAFQQQEAFYNGYLTGQSQTFYYGYTKFEASALNRPLESYAPGNSWAGTAGQSNEANRHGIDTRYAVNTVVDNVQIWKVTDNGPGTFGTYSSVGAYAPGALTKIVSEDEHGGEVIEFKDQAGSLILKKVLLTASRDMGAGQNYIGWLSTYYLYDDLNRLRCVVQPKGVDFVRSAGFVLTNTSILAEQCFRYEYDYRNRLIFKQVPGAAIEEMVYDKRDRLVMKRHGNLASQGYWEVNKYDNLNRLTQNYLILNNRTRVANQTSCDSSFNYPVVNVSDLMQENYYDDYSWVNTQPFVSSTINSGDNISSFFNMSFNTAPLYAQPMTPDYAGAKGKPTGNKVRIFGTSTYLYSVSFFDDHGRIIQVQKGNVSGGYDRYSTQYDFAGRPLAVLHRQSKGGAAARFIRELTKYTYDHAGRVTSITKKIGQTGADQVLASNTYDELGRLKSKTVGAGLEIQSYDYNVRGWLLGANRASLTSSAPPTSKFSYELAYDNTTPKVTPGSYGSAQFNGNIAGLMWRSAGDGENRKYNFAYDATSRLLKADFTQFSPSNNTFDVSANINYSVTIGDGVHADSAYDANGNLLHMQQMGWKTSSSTLIDDLRYTYQSNSNKLAKVDDAIIDPNSTLGDFKDGNTGATDDYSYDVNGNLTLDRNKAIASILYTHQNTAYEVNVTGKGKISYLYDNLGEKLKKTVIDNATGKTTVWLYMDNFVYKNDTLQFFTTEEGRARFDTTDTGTEATAFDLDYFLKDHLGNVRMVLTSEKDTAFYPSATIEDSRRASESAFYDIKSAQVKTVSTVAGASSPGTFEQNMYKVNGSVDGQKTGLGMVLKVMTGDKVAIRAESYYNIGGGSGSSSTIALTELLAAFASSTPVVSHGVTAAAISGIGTNGTALPNILPSSTPSTIANAHLCWILFDDQFRYVTSGADQVQDNGGYKNHTQFVTNPVAITKSGYLYIFVSNKSNLDVYFDNLGVTHFKGSILEETHYYPFGLTMAGISSHALSKMENKFRFNQIEQTNELDINVYDAVYRNLDPQIGRFWQIDPESDILEAYSPFETMGNNPISNVDPLGDFSSHFRAWWYRLWNGGGSIKKNEFGEWYVNKYRTNTTADGTPEVTGYRYYGKGRNQYTTAGEQWKEDDEAVKSGLFVRVSTQKEANERNLKFFASAFLPSVFKGGTILSASSKVEQVEEAIQKSEGIETVQITFGRNANQQYHAFRYTDEMGLSRSVVEDEVRKHLPTVISKIVQGKPLNEIIEIGGQKLQYTAYKLPDGTINIGRIHGAN